MKTEINNYNKIKFAMQYFGQLVLRYHSWIPEYCNSAVSEPSEITNESYLELTPLSKITDEDAIEVAKMLSHIKEWKISTPEWGAIKGLYCKEYGLCLLHNDLSFGAHDDDIDFEGAYIRLPKVIDFLRSRGYALPWNVITVEEQIAAGWVNLKS